MKTKEGQEKKIKSSGSRLNSEKEGNRLEKRVWDRPEVRAMRGVTEEVRPAKLPRKAREASS